MIVMQYKGGLGNQLFEYALYRSLIQKGKKVILDNSFFITKAWAYSIDIFPNIRMKKFRGFHNYPYYIIMGILRKASRWIHICYCESANKKYDNEVFKKDNCYISGYFQNENYFKQIGNELRSELSFPTGESKLQSFISYIEQENYVSIHIRRKDYLDLKDIYGGICDEKYYQEALLYISKKCGDYKYLVFSDDIEWVKENMEIPYAFYVNATLFDDYKDWYDMCLMSHCRHNIIANSTFSWWGAWLNTHKDKIVICPKRWDNINPNREIACESWISL